INRRTNLDRSKRYTRLAAGLAVCYLVNRSHGIVISCTARTGNCYYRCAVFAGGCWVYGLSSIQSETETQHSLPFYFVAICTTECAWPLRTDAAIVWPSHVEPTCRSFCHYTFYYSNWWSCY